MADNDTDLDKSSTSAAKQDEIINLRPTLFIGLGGTGMEVMLRVRRRILNAVWGGSHPVRIDSLADFPIAQFLYFDLDQGTTMESGKAQTTDLMADLVKLSDDDKICENFEIERYSRSDDDLARYPYVEAWSPLTPKRIRELGIDPSKGAGQIRAISRLYFFDKYPKIKEKLRNKLIWLKTGLSKEAQLNRLGLELEPSKFRIVVIASIAGGTGAGAFLDMGWLAGWVARETVSSAHLDLMLYMPTGYKSANKDRTEANGYASLMELETCLRPGGAANYLQRWDAYDRPILNPAPYDDVYLIDSGNLAEQHTEHLKHVYDMVADALFEDFASAEFANRKRSVAVNQRQHKITPFNAPVAANRYGDMKLSYHKGYSAFGQAILDTQGSVRRDIRVHRWSAAMLKAFFGVASGDAGGNRASDKQRDEFMAAQMHMVAQPFSDFPDFSSRNVELKLATGEFFDYTVTDDLLSDRLGPMSATVQQKVDARLEAIATGFEKDQWPTQVREAIRHLEKDSVRDQDSTADTTEDRVSRRRKELYQEITESLRDQLYNYLDNKQFGGLEYVLSMVEQIKARLENPDTGLIHALETNAARYQEIKDALRTFEYERLLANLEQTKGWALLGTKDKHAREILGQLKVEIGNYLKFHLRAKAAGEAAQLMREISRWLGERQDVDQAGNARWNGLVGELQAGRSAVLAMLGDIERRIAMLKEDVNKDHPTYIRIETPEEEMPLPPVAQLREWADEAFKDFGGSRKLFPMLAEPASRATLFAKLRMKADAHLRIGGAADANTRDPLVVALEKMTPARRQQLFSDLLKRAMPWIDGRLGREFTPGGDQFKCYIGVGQARDFEQFREELAAQVPSQAGISAAQVRTAFVDTGIPGRAVCYCELSGIPLTILRGLEPWRTSYRKESEKIPLHTHKDSTKFTHPLVPSADELNSIADDLKTFLTGVMLRILTRDTSQRIVPPGQYQFAVGRGDVRRMGNERAFRLNGLPPNYRQQIVDAVGDKLDSLNKTQLSALAALATSYARDVYTPRLVQDETGAEISSKGFASAIAEQLASDLKDRARRKGATEDELLRADKVFFEERLEQWTEVVADSDADAYAWEVRDSEQPRLKRAVRPEFFVAGWLEAAILGSPSPSGFNPVQPPFPAGAAAGAFPMAAGTPPPLNLPPQYQYYLAIQGQQSGPHTFAHVQHWIAAGQLPPGTQVWRDGLPQWGLLAQVPEFAQFLQVGPPPLPPPLPGGGPPPLSGTTKVAE